MEAGVDLQKNLQNLQVSSLDKPLAALRKMTVENREVLENYKKSPLAKLMKRLDNFLEREIGLQKKGFKFASHAQLALLEKILESVDDSLIYDQPSGIPFLWNLLVKVLSGFVRFFKWVFRSQKLLKNFFESEKKNQPSPLIPIFVNPQIQSTAPNF
jgi:hypothetical protein